MPINMDEYLAMAKPAIATRLAGIMKEFGDHSRVQCADHLKYCLRRAMYLVENDIVRSCRVR